MTKKKKKKKRTPTAAERACWSFYDSLLEAAGLTKRPIAICSLTSSHMPTMMGTRLNWRGGFKSLSEKQKREREREKERDWVTGHSCPATYLSRLIFLMWKEADAGYQGGSAGGSSKLHALIHTTCQCQA